jgi:hypothetical protein
MAGIVVVRVRPIGTWDGGEFADLIELDRPSLAINPGTAPYRSEGESQSAAFVQLF